MDRQRGLINSQQYNTVLLDLSGITWDPGPGALEASFLDPSGSADPVPCHCRLQVPRNTISLLRASSYGERWPGPHLKPMGAPHFAWLLL